MCVCMCVCFCGGHQDTCKQQLLFVPAITKVSSSFYSILNLQGLQDSLRTALEDRKAALMELASKKLELADARKSMIELEVGESEMVPEE